MSIVTILIVLLVLAVLFGGYGTSRHWGYYSWSPTGLLLIVLLILLFTGGLR